MLRKTIFTAAAALAVFVTVSTISTDVSAAGRFGGFQNHQAGRVIAGLPHRSVGAGGLVRQTGGGVRCWSAECGGGTVPIDDKYVLRGCGMTPAGQPLPPHCQGVVGVPRGTVHGFRR